MPVHEVGRLGKGLELEVDYGGGFSVILILLSREPSKD